MRPIKFREWETERKTMSYSKREDFDDMVGFRFDHEEGGKRVLMQYTGFTDKNGKEIYEGDIDASDEPMYVAYEGGCFGLKYKDDSYFDPFIDWEELLIEGNIYDNPELLEK